MITTEAQKLKESKFWTQAQRTGYLILLWGFKSFFNRCYSLLSFGGPQLYNLAALPFTYGQYVVIELADKLYNSVTVFCASWKYVFHIGHKWEQNVD